MFYVLEDGRVLPSKELIEDEKYIEVSEYPNTIYQDGKVGVIVGIDTEKNTIKYNFVDVVEPQEPISQPTEIEIMMQSFAGIELQNLEIQQGQQLLAQQLTDLELALPK